MTDITYIRTWKGWLYLAVVLDLYARQAVGWSMKPTLARELAQNAPLTVLWWRNPKARVIVHSDQGSQFRERAATPMHARPTGNLHAPTPPPGAASAT